MAKRGTSNMTISSTAQTGLKIKKLKEQLGVSNTEFASKTGITESFMRLIEQGFIPLASRDNMKIINAFNLSPNWLDLIDVTDVVLAESKNNNPDPVKKQEETKTSEATAKTTLELVKQKLEKTECAPKVKAEDEIKAEVKQEVDTEANPSSTIHKPNHINFKIEDADALKKARAMTGVSRKDLAESIGVSSVLIGYIENGKRTMTDSVKVKINEYFNDVAITEAAIIMSSLSNNDKSNAAAFDENLISNEELLEKMAFIKKTKNYTQSVISEKTGINRSQLSMIENNKANISKKVKMKLIEFIHAETISNEENPLLEANYDNGYEQVDFSSEVDLEAVSDMGFAQQENVISFATEETVSSDVCSKQTSEELLRAIESMKKMRDEITKNIESLEQLLSMGR